MNDTADLNLIIAMVNPDDALHERARRHLRGRRLLAPFSVGIELLVVSKKRGVGLYDSLAEAEKSFDLENRDILYTAAEAVESGEVKTMFDALHLADAMHRDVKLHTADAELLRTSFPTQRF